MSQPFELVNLGASIAENIKNLATHESSDDGLDPYEFISHEDAKRTKDKKKSSSPNKTPTLLSSDLINSSTYLADTISGSKLIESFNSLGSLQFQSHVPLNEPKELPQVYLHGQNESLQRELRTVIRKHEKLLSEGANCTQYRQSAGRLLNQLSEINVQLHEVYSDELEFTAQFLKKLSKWNSKRTSVLTKIKLIKSDGNKYGTKLQGLLDQRREVDDELELLQNRIQALNLKKDVLNLEIGETISVLESRSAKYVSLFRTLEKQGKEAVYNYLATETSSDANVRSLVRSIPVDSCFTSLKAANEHKDMKLVVNKPDTYTVEISEHSIEKTENKPTQIGMEPYVIPTSEPLSNTHKQNSSPYDKGFSSGAEQVERVKESIATFVNHVFTNQPSLPKKNSKLDDDQNIITEMMDLDPIVHLLESKSDAMEAILKSTSKLSELYHKHSLLWADVCFYLEVNEDKAYETISNSGDPKSILPTLEESFEYLKVVISHRISNYDITTETKYILALLKNEWNNVAVALDQISQTNNFTSQLENLESLAPEAQSIGNKYLLHSRITSTGNDEAKFREKVSHETTKEYAQKNNFSLSFKKGVKKE